MIEYLILIECGREYQLIAPDECRDMVRDCRQVQAVLIKSKKKIYELNGQTLGNELSEKYLIPNCSQTGCERFFSSTILRPLSLDGYNYLRLGDLELKKK